MLNFSANAGSWKNYDKSAKEREKKGMIIPSYCKARFRKNFPEVTAQEYAVAQEFLGETMPHVHHFCLALNYIWDLDKPGAPPNPWLAKQGIGEVDYYYSRTPKDHPVMRDVHRAYSTLYRLAGDYTKSTEHYEKSLQISSHKPTSGNRPTGKTRSRNEPLGRPSTPSSQLGNRFSPTASASKYVEMADKMMRLGILGEAVELLELARKIDPDSKVIQSKLKAAKAAKAAKALH